MALSGHSGTPTRDAISSSVVVRVSIRMCMGEHTAKGAPSSHSRLSVFRRHAGDDGSGFTLIELLIVIVVLGVLSGTVIFALNGVNSSAAVASCHSDAETVEAAVEAYNTQTGQSDTNTDVTQSALTTLNAQGNAYLHSWPQSS